MGVWTQRLVSVNPDGSQVRRFYYTNDDGSMDPTIYDMLPDKYTPDIAHNDLPFSGSQNNYVTNRWTGVNFYVNIDVYDADHPFSKNVFNVTVNVPTRNFAIETGLRVDIPYPYPLFTDTPFFITDQYGMFISEYYYSISENRKYISFTPGAPLGLYNRDDIRFVFCHNHGEYAVLKKEVRIMTKKSVTNYVINDTPYDEMVNLQSRVRVFFRRKMITEPGGDYKFNDLTGTILLNADFNIQANEELVILFFYTGHLNTRATPYLPQSGYIYLNKHDILRNYNKRMLPIFVNGKLIPMNQVLDVTNNIHKISTDIKSRHDLQVLNASPKLDALIPFYKSRFFPDKGKEQKPRSYIFPVTLEVYANKQKKNRYHFEESANPIFPMDLLEKYPSCYLTLMHHGTAGITYTCKFYSDDYSETPENMGVYIILRSVGNDEETEPMDYAIKMGQVTTPHTNALATGPICGIQISNLISSFNANTDAAKIARKAVDGVYARFQIKPQTVVDQPVYVYYDLQSSGFEKVPMQYVGLFEWRLSTGINGGGKILYNKIVECIPTNLEEIKKEIEAEKVN